MNLGERRRSRQLRSSGLRPSALGVRCSTFRPGGFIGRCCPIPTRFRVDPEPAGLAIANPGQRIPRRRANRFLHPIGNGAADGRQAAGGDRRGRRCINMLELDASASHQAGACSANSDEIVTNARAISFVRSSRRRQPAACTAPGRSSSARYKTSARAGATRSSAGVPDRRPVAPTSPPRRGPGSRRAARRSFGLRGRERRCAPARTAGHSRRGHQPAERLHASPAIQDRHDCETADEDYTTASAPSPTVPSRNIACRR
jgi:hypothetical protein